MAAEGDTHTIYSDSFVPLNELVTRLLSSLLMLIMQWQQSSKEEEETCTAYNREKATFITQMHKSKTTGKAYEATSRDQ